MTEHFTAKLYGTDVVAKRERDARARRLRAHGYHVTCRKWDFTDLARAIDYTLEYDAPCCTCVGGPGFDRTRVGEHHDPACAAFPR